MAKVATQEAATGVGERSFKLDLLYDLLKDPFALASNGLERHHVAQRARVAAALERETEARAAFSPGDEQENPAPGIALAEAEDALAYERQCLDELDEHWSALNGGDEEQSAGIIALYAPGERALVLDRITELEAAAQADAQ
jgi:hypothetical protein